ncbi:hypothetical protein TNIN_103001 [Trichonephila inaurata madagascariensis]|uniref:Uncharacterized protein n=1 Tax=Trichonephila inaurata madagascariensis TaxID=2747483 RepID=A0A8X7CI71_9ARAC|nr:hypothetical protein TNIN_103001 [Trichonephila inaurata madagascariensis]
MTSYCSPNDRCLTKDCSSQQQGAHELNPDQFRKQLNEVSLIQSPPHHSCQDSQMTGGLMVIVMNFPVGAMSSCNSTTDSLYVEELTNV